jgi:hypothetical protein
MTANVKRGGGGEKNRMTTMMMMMMTIQKVMSMVDGCE